MYHYRLVIAKMSLDHPWMRRPIASHPRRAEDWAPVDRRPRNGGRR